MSKFEFNPWVWMYDAKLSSAELTFRMFGITMFKVPMEEIESVRRVGFFEAFVSAPSIHWTNRSPSKGVLVVRKKGWGKIILITPADPEMFIAFIEQEKKLLGLAALL